MKDPGERRWSRVVQWSASCLSGFILGLFALNAIVAFDKVTATILPIDGLSLLALPLIGAAVVPLARRRLTPRVWIAVAAALLIAYALLVAVTTDVVYVDMPPATSGSG